MSEFYIPRKAERFLEALGADTEFRDSIIGDLAEEFGIRVQWDGPRVARRWYYRESLRVAPYLVRDWWRNLRWNDAGYFGTVVLLSSLSVVVLEALLQRGASSLGLFTKMAQTGLLTSAGFAVLMLWTLIDGAFAGYVAARIGRRAPLPSALLVALMWMGVMVWDGWHSVPLWFLAANVTTMFAGTIAGGALRSLRSASRGERLATQGG